MTQKEKADELINNFCLPHLSYIDAKQCALICVDEIISTGLLLDSSVYVTVNTSIEYWQQVKQEIENL